jgi:hypothetical protein
VELGRHSDALRLGGGQERTYGCRAARLADAHGEGGGQDRGHRLDERHLRRAELALGARPGVEDAERPAVVRDANGHAADDACRLRRAERP